MYVNVHYGHNASFYKEDEFPFFTNKANLHVVNEPWLEDEATYRQVVHQHVGGD